MSKDANSGIYTDDELKLLDTTKKVRLDIIKDMTKNGVPDRVGDLRVLNEVMTSAESSMHTQVNNRLKHQDTGNTEAMLELVAETLKQAANVHTTPRTTPVVLPDEHTTIDIVPGETDINPSQLSIEDFVKQETKG